MAAWRAMTDSDAQHDPQQIAEHTQPQAPTRSGFTFWHHYLAAMMQRRLDSPALEVRAFEKLGTLPLEADIIILRRRADIDLTGLAPDFDFLLILLRDYLIVEYKSPSDRLQLADLDTVRAYAMLCKRKFSAAYDESIAVVMLYSRVESGFFESCARNGYTFVQTEPGIRACTDAAVKYYAVHLTEYAAERESDPILLFSSQYRKYRPLKDGPGHFRTIYEEVLYKETKHMAQTHPSDPPEGFAELRDWFVQSVTKEELSRLPPSIRLSGLAPEERLRDLQAQEVLDGLSPEQRTQLAALLQQPSPR